MQFAWAHTGSYLKKEFASALLSQIENNYISLCSLKLRNGCVTRIVSDSLENVNLNLQGSLTREV